MVIPYLSVFIINYIIFLPKERQLKQYERYKEAQSATKDVLAILFSVLSVAIFFTVIIQGRKYL